MYIGGDWRLRGCEFEFQQQIQDESFFKLSLLYLKLCYLKWPKINEKEAVFGTFKNIAGIRKLMGVAD